MNKKNLNLLLILCFASLFSCSQDNKATVNQLKNEDSKKETVQQKHEPHQYGGWYCPDNLNGFPPVNIRDWDKVPVVNGRMATKEETQNGTSLIFVDLEKFPNAKPLNMTMPKLAKFYNEYSKREEYIIVIQALNIDNDSIVGFRYLNGGNGSARLSEVKFVQENSVEKIPNSRFVTYNITINAPQNVIWEVLTSTKHTKALQTIFDKENKLKSNWRNTSNVNFYYANHGNLTAEYGSQLFGNFYIQNDYANYGEKFFLHNQRGANETELKIVCGPFEEEFETQQKIMENWAKKVKELSEVN